ncbi:MAG: hypothetical protein ACE37F_17940 [Nannocystaceae bacterium]|nr:hypothetical protein [bacterium]
MRVLVDGHPHDLRQEDFVAAGGQGRVYARGDIAFKIFDDASATPPRAKLQALRALAGPHVAAPDRAVTDTQGAVIGYTMPFFRGAHSWAQLCTPAFRRRAGIDDAAALGLVHSLGAALTAIHAHGSLVVDLSENNVLVRGREVCLIDLDSWQTPQHRATALTPSIASPHVPTGHFDVSTDWFAFAVLTSTLLLGIHPFKGKHPRIKGLAARMRAGVSVFDPSVRLPAVCRDPSSVPRPLARWLRSALESGASTVPPLGRLPTPTRRPAAAAQGHRYPEAIRWVLVEPNAAIVATTTRAFEDAQCWHDDARPLRALGRTAEGHPYVLQEGPDGLQARVRGLDARVRVDLRTDDLLSHEGRVFARTRGRLVELQVRLVGARPVLLTREVARVLPLATQLFPGVALQNVLGTWRASWLGRPDGSPQVELPIEASAQVLDARRAGDRLVVLSQRDRVISRDVYTLGHDGAVRTHARDANVDPWGTTFVQRGEMYVEVGSVGLNAVGRSPPDPWPALEGPLDALDLHTDGHRLLATAGSVLRDVTPRSVGRERLGFDASRCR